MHRIKFVALILIIISPFLYSQTPPVTSNFGFAEMLRIKKVREPRVSPDGKFVVFSVSEADTSENRWISQLWRVSTATGELIQLTRGKHSARFPRWTPDAREILFLSNREGNTNIYRLSNSGGEARRLFDHPAAIRSFQISKNGRMVYFLAEDSLTKKEKLSKEKAEDAFFYDETQKPIHLWEYDVLRNRKRQLTFGNYSIREFSLSPDQSRIAFVAAPTAREDDYLKQEIYLFELNGQNERRLTQNEIAERNLDWAPDGKYISFTSDANSTLETYYQDSIFLFDLQTGLIVDALPNFPFQVMEYFWTPKGKEIIFIANVGVNTQFFRYDRRAGGIRQLTFDQQEVRAPHFQPDLNRLVYILSTPAQPFDVYFSVPDKLPGKRLTDMNAWLDLYQMAQYRTIRWKSADGHEVEGILILPAPQRNGPLPLIVQLHGGPESSYRNYFGESWATYPQIWAAHGYAVFQPNYRGSTGYGDDVMRAIIGHYFEKDVDDIISGIDFLIREGMADPTKMAVMGWSAGGHLTNWLITHFQRFGAACSGAGGANWFSFYAQTDVQYIREIWHQGPPYENLDYYMKKSPVVYVQQAKTPTLILCGEEDRRVPFPQSLEMYRGLKRYGVPVKFVAFPREKHGLREVKHQLYKMKSEFQWVEKHLFDRDWDLESLN
ncbi:MAG: S9 family peptidase [Calditrichia bacterium]